MPHGDKTGPIGRGPMTGRALGFCSGYSNPGYMNFESGGELGRRKFFGKGRGKGLGRGRGFGRNRGWNQ